MEQTQGERVRELRKSMGMTLEQFGARLGKTKAAISEIERGRNGLTKSTALLICQTYRVNMAWLIDGEGQMLQAEEDELLGELFHRYNCSKLTKELIKCLLELEREDPPDIGQGEATLRSISEAEGPSRSAGGGA